VSRAAQAARPGTDALARHPRHALLAALVAGLLCGPRWPAAVAALAVAGLAGAGGGPGALRPLAAGAIVALLAGAVLADARLQALDRTALGPLLGRDVSVTAIALEAPRLRAGGARVLAARLSSGPGRGERVVLRAPPWARVRGLPAIGAEIAAHGRLERLGRFDGYERRRHAHAVLHADRMALTGRHRGGLPGALDGVRARTERVLSAGIPAPQGALARGMVLGEDAALPEDLREGFRATGLAHLVAASGANVLLLATLVLAAGTAAGLGLSARLLVALVLVAAYVPLAGGGPSIQRAGVMGAAGLVAVLAGRPASRAYALLLAAAATLALDPRAAEDPGWQLSFAAVLGLLALAPAAGRALRRGGVPAGLAEATAVTAVATVATAPLIALHFGRVSLVSLPANVLAAPAVAPVMWLGTIAGAVGQVAPGLAAPVVALAALPLGYLTGLAERGAQMPGAEVALARPGPGTVAVLYGGLALAAAAWLRRAHRREHDDGGPARARRPAWRGGMGALAIAGLAAGGLLLSRPPGPPAGLVVSFLDIGQGDATLVQHGRHAVLVDTGPPGGPILRRLREAGVDDLDVLVLTHASDDHDGGAGAVLARHRVRLVLDGGEVNGRTPGLRAAAAQAARAGVRRIASDAGQVLRAGPIELRVLWPRRDPPAEPGADPNLRATVLHVRDGAFDLLLSADAESEVLAPLDLPRVDAMKVPHHGSAEEDLPGLLRRLRPRVAVVEVGPNSYGHPDPGTLRALRAAVAVVRRTDRDGTVRLAVDGGRMRVRTAR
jgi:competence protein ComEC